MGKSKSEASGKINRGVGNAAIAKLKKEIQRELK